MKEKLRIGIMISGSGTNMQAIVRACNNYKLIDGEVVFVGACNPDAKGLIFAKDSNIPTFVVDYKDVFENILNYDQPDEDLIYQIRTKQKVFVPSDLENGFKKMLEKIKKRIIVEKLLLKEMAKYPFDLLVLAGFMRVLTPYFIDKVNTDPQKPRIINIHPAILPAFPGENGYEDTLDYGCKVGGCTVHFVDYGEDTGPIIGQKSFDITPNMNLDDVKKKGLSLEYELYPECIQLFAKDRLRVFENEKGRKIVLITETHNHPTNV